MSMQPHVVVMELSKEEAAAMGLVVVAYVPVSLAPRLTKLHVKSAARRVIMLTGAGIDMILTAHRRRSLLTLLQHPMELIQTGIPTPVLQITSMVTSTS